MSQTAWSQQFGQELDFKQLLKRLNLIATVDDETFGLSQETRDWMRADLLCPSCRCAGASPVLSDVAKPRSRNTRQAHFRFLNAAKRSAHDPGCDFYALDDAPGFTRGFDVQFSANDRDTKLVRELVCKAIATGTFQKTDIFAMRSWFLEYRDANTFQVAGSEAMVNWLFAIGRLGAQPLAFAEFHVTLPGFSVRRAAERQMAHHYQAFRAQLPRVRLDAPTSQRAIRLLATHQGQRLIAIEGLREKYDLTMRLTALMAEMGSLRLAKPYTMSYRPDKAPASLLAFAATLLFVSNWDLHLALSKFATIVVAPAPSDMTLGNVMGLNPFHDFSALEIVRFVSGLTPPDLRPYNFTAEMAATSAPIEAAYRAHLATSA